MSATRQDESGAAAAPLAWEPDPTAFPDESHPQPARFPPRLFWLLHLGGWAGYFLHGYLSGIAHGKDMGYWKLPLTTALAGMVATWFVRRWRVTE